MESHPRCHEKNINNDLSTPVRVGACFASFSAFAPQCEPGGSAGAISSPMKIVEYALIELPHTHELTPLINDMIADGWQPFGAPFYGTNNHIYEFFFAQAMVKYATTEAE